MFFIILAASFYAGALVLGALAARNANTAVVTLVMNLASALLPLIVALPIAIKQGLSQAKLGLGYALLAGCAIALFTLALNKSLATEKVAVVTPLVFGGAIFFSSLLSHFIFNEKITFLQACGLTLLVFGFLVIVYARSTGK